MNKIWLYRAFKSEEDYKKGESYFHEVFDDHGRMKEFSAEFSKTAKQEYPDYVSTYEVYYKHGEVDPKEIGVPNICFSLGISEDKEELYRRQRIERGFDDSETWSLVNTISRFIIPRLEVFIELAGQMIEITDESRENLNAILEMLKLTNYDDGVWQFDAEDSQKINKGLDALKEEWFGLWW